MPRVVVNGEEIRNPLLRFVVLIVGCVAAAVLLASAAAWVLILLGLGTVAVLLAFALALLAAAVLVPLLVVAAWRRRMGRR